MSDEFDSGDDLFDNVDVDDVLQGSPATAAKRKPANGNGAPSAAKRQKKTATTAKTTTTSSRLGAQDEADDGAPDESHLDLAQRILQDKFGHDDFRHEQKGAISRILAGKNSLVVFPTGAGKSLCYQVSSSPQSV